MKVLITNGSDNDKWYHEKQGLLLDVLSIGTTHYKVPNQNPFRIYGVRKEDGALLYTEAEYTEAHQERLQLREEVKELMRQNKAHEENIDGFMEDRNSLLRRIQQLSRGEQKKPVVLPREVAEAIEWFRKQGINNEIIYKLSSDANDGKYSNALFRWVNGDGDRDELMKALVNDYTVEETPEETSVKKVADMIRKWTNNPTFEDEEAECMDLAISIIERVKEIYSKV